MSHTIRCFDYVNRPYDQVRAELLADPLGIFERATHVGSARAGQLPELRVRLGAIEVSADVTIRIISVSEDREQHRPATRIVLEWEGARSPGLFPKMTAILSLYALSGHETQLDLSGVYQPPLGVLGATLDTMVGHRYAETACTGFIEAVAAAMRAPAGHEVSGPTAPEGI
jgi:hypothetical protein